MLFFSNEFSIDPEIQGKKKTFHGFTKILSCTTVFNIGNNIIIIIIYFILFFAANQHIRLISERSCDTEDWSNDAENCALHHRNKLYFKIYSN